MASVGTVSTLQSSTRLDRGSKQAEKNVAR